MRDARQRFVSSFITPLATASLLFTAAVASAQYNAQILLPPAEFSQTASTHAYAMNNSGQVFGEVVLSGTDLRPVLWTDGIGAALPVPAGYSWESTRGFVNDDGTVMSWLRTADGHPYEQRIVIWTNGIAQVLPPPDSRSCGRQFITPYGFNNQGHALFTRTGEGCLDVWVWDGSAFQFVLDIFNFAYGFSNVSVPPHSHLNDAGHIAIDQLPMSPPSCSGAGGSADILTGTQFSPIAAGGGAAINNRDQMLVYCTIVTDDGDANTVKFWDGATLVDLGPGAQADLNDRGEIVFNTGGGLQPVVPRIYKNGSVQDLVLPSAPHFTIDSGSLINNAGQIVLSAILGVLDQAVLFTPRTPVITWPAPQGIVYGTALGSTQLNATANVPGTFSYTPAAGAVLHAGNTQTLSLTFSPNDLTHYDATTASVTINVQSAPLVVAANNAAKVFGAPLPAFSAGYAGFVNGDGPGSLGGALTFSTPATATSPTGPYPITPAGLASSDYTIAFVPGTLTIAPANTTTTAFALPSPNGFLQPSLLAALVGPVAPGAGAPDGVVQFKDGATLIGSASVTGGIAYVVANGLAPGTHAITAVYGGSSNFAGSSSTPASLTVQPVAVSTLTFLAGLTNPQAAGQPASFAALVFPLAGGHPTGCRAVYRRQHRCSAPLPSVVTAAPASRSSPRARSAPGSTPSARATWAAAGSPQAPRCRNSRRSTPAPSPPRRRRRWASRPVSPRSARPSRSRAPSRAAPPRATSISTPTAFCSATRPSRTSAARFRPR